MQVSVVDAPDPLIAWPDIKGHLRADSDDDQTLVEGYIAAATSWLDAPNGWLGRAIGQQTLKVTLPDFGTLDCAPLPFGPVTGSVTIVYFDGAGQEQTLAPTGYQVVGGDSIAPAAGNSWPTAADRPDAISITYGVGYEQVPPAILQAIMLLVGHWYANRETVGPNTNIALPFAVEALLSTFRRWTR